MAFMRKRYLHLAAFLCVLLYTAAIGTAFFRIMSKSSELERVAPGEFKELVEKATAAAALGFPDGPFFRESIRISLEKTKTIAAIIVTGPNGPEYAIEREGGYIENGGGSPRFSARLEIAPGALVAPLRLESVRNATVSAAVYRFLPDELIAVLRDSLLATLAALLAAVFFFLFASNKKKEVTAEETETENPAASIPANNTFNEEYEIPDIAEDVDVGVSAPTASSQQTNCESEKPAGLYGTDGLLGWEEYLEERLDAELRRAASFEQDLVLVILEADFEEPQAEEKFKSFAEDLVSYFSFKDLSFRRGKYGAAVILPNIDVDQGLRFTENFMLKCKERGDNVEIGLTARAGRLVDAGRLITEAKAALDRAQKKRPISNHGVQTRPGTLPFFRRG